MDRPRIEVAFQNQIAEVVFYHPKANAFSWEQLTKLTEVFQDLAQDERIRAIVLRSFGGEVFSAGAYLDELLQLSDIEAGKKFFWGFAQVILNMIRCPKPIVACVSGKVVGGALGLIAACDHVIAASNVSARLSELSIGIGPFVIEPVIRHRIGLTHFMALSLNPLRWHASDWCKAVGLVAEVVIETAQLKSNVWDFAQRFNEYNPETIYEMKKIFWKGTDHWDKLLRERAAISARLTLTPYTKAALNKFKQR